MLIAKVEKDCLWAFISWGAMGCFDVLRLLAALMVVFGHSYALTGRSAAEPLDALAGGVAVYTFFAISGYLITLSWQRDPHLGRFMWKRVLRIFPALVVVIVASFAIIGPLNTSLDLSDYFSRRESWSYLGKVFIYPAQIGLPDVFSKNPYPYAVNGSLWTLRLEFSLYLVVAALGLVGFLNRRGTCSALALVCVVADFIIMHTSLAAHVPYLHQVETMFANAAPFFVGAALSQVEQGAKLPRLAAGLVLLMLLAASTPVFQPLLLLALPVVVLSIARCGSINLGRNFGDLSYGLYLWAFPIQQTFIKFFPWLSPVQLFATASFSAAILAALSWHLVEKRALKLKAISGARARGFHSGNGRTIRLDALPLADRIVLTEPKRVALPARHKP
jgi:peptidoglycan/LPS O-acetylase OafA/YrhL